ncbi:MAG: hypothetical protein IPL39_23095 [Opitutaceae bacterium]|nr:hypothetical protein [Opitutaceae bacterium]
MAQIMRAADVCRQTVFTYRDIAGGRRGGLVAARAWGGTPSVVRGAVREELLQQLQGKFRRAKDALAWVKKRTRRQLSEGGMRKLLHRLGGKLKVPRKPRQRIQRRPRRSKRSATMEELAGTAARAGQPVRLWVLDEHRYGLCR